VQAALGIERGSAFDVQAVCSGFVYGLTVADSLLKAGQGTCALVIGAETYSRILDWTDRSTCVLFGDGAAAVVMRTCEGNGTIADRGILAARLRSDGRYRDKLYVDGGVSSTMTVGHLRMEGREVFKHAVINIATVMADTIKDAGLEPKDIDWFVPHQANRRILEGTAKKLGVTEERVVMTLDKHGNTSAASIPLALDTAVRDGRIKRGDLVLMEAMGGGFTWGAVLVRW
jgi:3-oxoacyl-[acyl-carrier-protein] synthase-3